MYENKLSFMFQHLQLLTFLVILPILLVSPISRAASEEATSQIQEFNGFLEGGRGVVYTLSNSKKGDTLYAYLTNTSGNLDPMLGILKKAGDPEAMYIEVAQSMVTSEENILKTFSQAVDNHTIVWVDDNGNGYDASLQFTIPTDGSYFLLAGYMVINQSFGDFKPSFTFGSYRLLLGLSTPGVDSRQASYFSQYKNITSKYNSCLAMLSLQHVPS